MNIDRKNNKEYMAEYRKKNNEEITCDICGGHYKSYYKSQHYKSQKHKSCINIIEKINNEIITNIEKITKNKSVISVEKK